MKERNKKIVDRLVKGAMREAEEKEAKVRSHVAGIDGIRLPEEIKSRILGIDIMLESKEHGVPTTVTINFRREVDPTRGLSNDDIAKLFACWLTVVMGLSLENVSIHDNYEINPGGDCRVLAREESSFKGREDG